MKKGWIIVLAIVLVVVGLAAVLFFSLRSLVDQQPSLGDKTVLVLELTGELPESAPADPFMQLFEPKAMSFRDLVTCIEKARVDKRIVALWLKIDSPALGWAKVEELQLALDAFRKSGKTIVASMEMGNERDYACALPADRIFLPGESYFEFDGFVAQAQFMKDMFNKFGIEPEVENIGKYKSAGDMLKLSAMSEAQREVMNVMLDQRLAQFQTMVEKYRQIPRDQVFALLDKSVYGPQEALGHKLIDGIKYADEIEDFLKTKTGETAKKRLTTIAGNKYRKVTPPDYEFADGEQIAVIYAVGTIMRGPDSYSPIFGRNMGSESVIESIRKARQNKAVKGIILRVDSPGGDGLASDLMWRELRQADKEKPVVASMSDVAASGGYYIAMGCRKIVADPATITGSIGVVSAKFNLKGIYDWLGLHNETIQRGRWADMMNDSRPMTPEERELFRQRTRKFYDRFVAKAAECRGKSYEQLEPYAQGRVWSGTDALQHGLVDMLGGLDKAIEVVRQEAKIKPSQRIRLIEYPEPKKLIDQVMESLAETQVRQVHPRLREDLQFLGRFVLPGPNAMLAVMPYRIDIH
mgnify:CR=1 FL=1